MAKINESERAKYIEKITPYREATKQIIKEEQFIRLAIEGKKEKPGPKRFDLSESMLNLATNYMVINGVSVAVQQQRDENALNDARKALYKSVIYLEETVSNYIDAPFADYEKYLASIDSVSPARRYYLVQKMGLGIELLVNAYGDNTKWRWTFVELEGRFATVAKNLINLRDIIANSDFESPHYEPTALHLQLVKKLLMMAADRYREKYELSTQRSDDFKASINYLSALKRLNTLTGDSVGAAKTQKKLDTWTDKLTSDMTKQDQSGKGKV